MDTPNLPLLPEPKSEDEDIANYEATDDTESDTVLRERYLRLKAQEKMMNPDELIKKLRSSTLFDNLYNE